MKNSPSVLLPDNPLENSSVDGWPSLVDMKVILPGLVHYEDLRNSKGETVGGNVLVTKDALDRMAASLEGKPLINWDHRSVRPEDFKKGRAQGIITTPALFNATDGWYHAKALVWDESTRKNIEAGFSISCAYTVSEWGEGPGTHNAVPYEREVRNGNYTHIAVVPSPRYEGARIELLNSGGNAMGLLSFFKKDKPDEKVEFDAATAKVAIEGGSEIALSELINSYKTVQAAKKAEPVKCGLDDLIEVDGKKVAVRELMNAHLEMYKNAEEEKRRQDEEEKKNAAAEEEKKRKDDEEKKNAADEAEKKRKEDDEKKNSAATTAQKVKDEAAKRAADLDEVRNRGLKVPMPELESLESLMAEGDKRYGRKTVAAK